MFPRKRFLSYVIMAAAAVTSFQCSDDDSTPADPKITGKSITSFKFSDLTPAVTATIDDAAKTIAATVPAGTNVTALAPTIETSESASVSPTSRTAQNFTTPVTYTVTAEDGSKQTYTVTVTVEEEGEISCYPTLLPGDEAMMEITYNNDLTVATVDYQAFDEESDTGYRSEFVYANGKPNRINNFSGDEMVSYTIFTYGTNTITETYYSQYTDFEAEHYYLYHLDGGRITSWGYHSILQGGARLDSAVFTYTNDNITQMDGYGDGEDVEWSNTFEYDDKINPYAQVGFSGDDDEYFNNLTLSKNNVTRAINKDGDDEDVVVLYTYNEHDLPQTRTFDGTPVRTFGYDCK
jgi:hypothetical protein